MFSHGRSGLSAILLAVGTFLCASQGHSQVFNLENNRVQMAELDGLWRFHTGDDMHWADPGFDDGSWKLLRSDEDWSQQGYANHGGFAWYRFTLIVPDGSAPLALYLPSFSTSYQVFADGRLIGQFGRLPPISGSTPKNRVSSPFRSRGRASPWSSPSGSGNGSMVRREPTAWF